MRKPFTVGLLALAGAGCLSLAILEQRDQRVSGWLARADEHWATFWTAPEEQESPAPSPQPLDAQPLDDSPVRASLAKCQAQLTTLRERLGAAERRADRFEAAAAEATGKAEQLKQRLESAEDQLAGRAVDERGEVYRLTAALADREIEIETIRLAVDDATRERAKIAASLERATEQAADAERELAARPSVNVVADMPDPTGYRVALERVRFENQILTAKLAKAEYTARWADKNIADAQRERDRWHAEYRSAAAGELAAKAAQTE
jgi:chromosome segregation ATPase